MIERKKYSNEGAGNQLQSMCIRMFEAKEAGAVIPDELLTNKVFIGLMWAARSFGGLIGTYCTGDLQTALFACRLLIGHLLHDGLPETEPYGIFTMPDLNALFHVHSLLQGSDYYPEIPFQTLQLGADDEGKS